MAAPKRPPLGAVLCAGAAAVFSAAAAAWLPTAAFLMVLRAPDTARKPRSAPATPPSGPAPASERPGAREESRREEAASSDLKPIKRLPMTAQGCRAARLRGIPGILVDLVARAA